MPMCELCRVYLLRGNTGADLLKIQNTLFRKPLFHVDISIFSVQQTKNRGCDLFSHTVRWLQKRLALQTAE